MATAEEKQALIQSINESIKKTGFNIVRFENPLEYSGKKIRFSKVDLERAQYTIEGEGNDSSYMKDLVIEVLQFFATELEASKITEIIDYRKFLTKLVSDEGGHIKLTKPFNYNGREVTINEIAGNGAINYIMNRENKKSTIAQMEEAMLECIYDEVKKNNYL